MSRRVPSEQSPGYSQLPPLRQTEKCPNLKWSVSFCLTAGAET